MGHVLYTWCLLFDNFTYVFQDVTSGKCYCKAHDVCHCTLII